jgi:radical SAM superfamily enzyme YgiQ (UPF0313 family)
VKIYLVNPSDVAFGVAVITPRWLFVLAAATPERFGTPVIVDETVTPLDLTKIQPGDVVGIGVHTGNALRGYALGKAVRAAGGHAVYGGIHTTLFPEEVAQHGEATTVVCGDGDLVWPQALADIEAGTVKPRYDGGRVDGDSFVPARWDLLPKGQYMFASVQTVRGCPKHCSFCSVWRTDGQKPRMRTVDAVVTEIVELRRRGMRFILLADDNFYPVSMKDLEQAQRREDKTRLHELEAIRNERFELMAQLAKLPSDTVLMTQITMEAAEDVEFLRSMEAARIRGVLVGVESVTPEGLKDVYKDFNLAGDELAERLRTFREHGVHVLGSFIFGLPSDRPGTFDATAALAAQANVTFAQFVMLTPFPGTLDFDKWVKSHGDTPPTVDGTPLTQHWLIPAHKRPKFYMPHPTMSPDEVRARTQAVWDNFYSMDQIWQRSRFVKSMKSRLAFVLISKLYRQMYANTGIATDSARHSRARRMASMLAKPTQKLFAGPLMPDLEVPARTQ